MMTHHGGPPGRCATYGPCGAYVKLGAGAGWGSGLGLGGGVLDRGVPVFLTKRC